MTALPVDTRTGFGGVTVAFARDDGAALMPDWLPQPRLVVRAVPGGGVVRQRLGFDPDQLSCVGEVADAADARALWALIGEEGTLTLPQAVGSQAGAVTYEIAQLLQDFPAVTLAALEPLGGRRNGRFRFRFTFEKDHVS